MGYSSDVRIATTLKGYNYLESQINLFLQDKNKEECCSLLEDVDVFAKNDFQVYFGWDNMNWKSHFEEVAIIEDTLAKFKDNGLTYRYAVQGEDSMDYIEHYYTADNEDNVIFPCIKCQFEDDLIKGILKERSGKEL